MSWIERIPYEKAEGKLKKLYDRIKGPNNAIDNVMSIHSLRPHTLEAHMVMYKQVLHNSNNTLPKWYLESIGVYVSYLNECNYCFQHHFTGYKRLIQNDTMAEAYKTAVENDTLETAVEGKYLLGLQYAKALTVNHTSINENNIIELRNAGFSDGEILEINQVANYFTYANKTVLGLGVNLSGDIIGLSPTGVDEDDWGHQ